MALQDHRDNKLLWATTCHKLKIIKEPTYLEERGRMFDSL